jgi:hypothetical protein
LWQHLRQVILISMGLAEGGIMAKQITREVMESALRCKTKAPLKLADQQGVKSEYEGLLAGYREEVRRKALGKIQAGHRGTEVARNIALTAAALEQSPSFVLDATLEEDSLALTFDGLRKVEDGPPDPEKFRELAERLLLLAA